MDLSKGFNEITGMTFPHIKFDSCLPIQRAPFQFIKAGTKKTSYKKGNNFHTINDITVIL